MREESDGVGKEALPSSDDEWASKDGGRDLITELWRSAERRGRRGREDGERRRDDPQQNQPRCPFRKAEFRARQKCLGQGDFSLG